MLLLKRLLIMWCTLCSATAVADITITPTQHPIDAWYEEQMADESVRSTGEMRNITNQARMKWEAEMNLAYQRLMQKLNTSQQGTLRKAQLQWLKYRDAEGKAIVEIVASQPGTIHQLSGTNLSMQLVRARTLTLILYEQEFEH